MMSNAKIIRSEVEPLKENLWLQQIYTLQKVQQNIKFI